jgi:hypothetical protein
MSEKTEKGPISRRAALRGIALGGGALVITQWKKPVVDAIVMPAHAQVSVFSASGGAGGAFAAAVVAP